MTLPTSGPISLSQVDTEIYAASSTSTISMNDSIVRLLFGVPSGAISMNQGYGKTMVTLTITSTILNFNMYSAATGSVPSGVTRNGTYTPGCIVRVIVNNAVVIGSTNLTTYAFDTGTGWNGGDTLYLSNYGYISGHGGNGSGGPSGGWGQAGGVCLHAQNPITIDNSSGYIYSGGGGGGGGGNWVWTTSGVRSSVGGGGGGGGGYVAGNYGGYGGVAANGTAYGHGGHGGGGGASGGAGGGGALGVGGNNGHRPGGAVVGGWPTGNYGAGGGGGGGASGGAGLANQVGSGHGKAITGISYVTFSGGGTRVYGGTI